MTDPNTPSSPHKKTRHSLSAIDKDALTAICSICGPTDIYKATSGNKQPAYMCATKSRQRSAAYRQSHPHIPHPRRLRPRSHALSHVDDRNKTAVCSQCGTVRIYIQRRGDTIFRSCSNASNQRVRLSAEKRQAENLEFAERYKLQCGCRNCGSRDAPKTLEFHAPGRDRRADRIAKLMKLKQERLLHELAKYDVLCKECHDQAHPQPPSKPRGKHKPLPFMSHTR